MKYISIDIETTGLDPEKHQILEFAAVYDDLENPKPVGELPMFIRRIYWDDLVISNYCTKLHRGLLMEIAKDYEQTPHNIITIDQLSGHFYHWLTLMYARYNFSNHNYNVAGKNFAGFDGQFLKKVPGFPPWFYRIIDVSSLYLTPGMNHLPSLSDIVGNQVSHRALSDALDVVRAIRGKALPNYPPVPEINRGYGHGQDS